MPCGTTLTASRKKTGAVKMKGYRAIGFAPFDIANKIVTSAPGIVSDLPAGLTQIYRFEVKNTADNFIETADKDLVTMTGMKKGVGTFALLYCDRAKNLLDAQALLDGTFNVFFEHNDGSITVAGINNGADIIAVVESTDANGFLFTLDTMEPIFASTLTTTALTDYATAIVAYA